MEFRRLPPPSSTSILNQRTTSILTMPWLRSQGPLQGTIPLDSSATASSVNGRGSKGNESLARPEGRILPSRLRTSASRPPRTKPVKGSSSATVVIPKEEPIDPKAALRCVEIIEALESELLLVKDWTPEKYSLRKHKLLEKTIEAITECEANGGWGRFTRSIRTAAWMAEMTRFRATPSTELDMSIFDKPPFVEETIVKQEHPPTPPRTPSKSPLKSALKRRASDGGLQARTPMDTPPTKRPKTMTTPSSRGGTLPSRSLPGRVEYPSRERPTTRRLPDPPIKEEPGSSAAFAAFEAAIFSTNTNASNTNTTPTSPSTPKRTPSRVKFLLPEPTTPTPISHCRGVPTDPTRSVKRIRDDQKERRASQKAALDDIPRIREQNAKLKKTVADLANTVKHQADTIQFMQEEHASFKEIVHARIDRLREDVETGRGRGDARAVVLEERVRSAEEEHETLPKEREALSSARIQPGAVAQVVESTLKTHFGTMNDRTTTLGDMRVRFRGLSESFELQQEFESRMSLNRRR